MASEKKTRRKIFYTIGGMGLTPDKNVKTVSGGVFTKKSRGLKSKINENE